MPRDFMESRGWEAGLPIGWGRLAGADWLGRRCAGEGVDRLVASCFSTYTARAGKNDLAKSKPTSAQRALRATGPPATIGGRMCPCECHPCDDITAWQTLLFAGAL